MSADPVQDDLDKQLDFSLDRQAIENILLHRGVALPITYVSVKGDGGEASTTIALTGREQFFEGHFESLLVMPAHWIIEIASLVSGVALSFTDEYKSRFNAGVGYVAGEDGVRFHEQVVPGDSLKVVVNKVRYRLGLWVYNFSIVRLRTGEEVTCAKGRLLLKVEEMAKVVAAAAKA